jgi:hypothetical protein
MLRPTVSRGVSVLVEDMSRNKCFLQVRISHLLRFIFICDLFTDSPSYLRGFLCFMKLGASSNTSALRAVQNQTHASTLSRIYLNTVTPYMPISQMVFSLNVFRQKFYTYFLCYPRSLPSPPLASILINLGKI